jgi:tetratricopeptide (TPR) repeat protein
VYYARALANVRRGDWSQARADLRRAVELDPLDATYRSELGWVESGWFGVGDELVGSREELDDALLQFSLSAALDPENDELARLSERYAELHSELAD